MTSLLSEISDPDSLHALDVSRANLIGVAMRSGDPSYSEQVQANVARQASSEAVFVAELVIDRHRLVGIECEYSFLAGTFGLEVGEFIAGAFEYAMQHDLPVLAIAQSGGARQQEGTLAFIQMLKMTEAMRLHRAQGLLCVTYLRNPTTGGVNASWASQGQVVWAEPHATIGFTGPRVARALGEPIEPTSIQTSEGLFHHGFVDDIIEPNELRPRLASLLSTVRATPSDDQATTPNEIPDGPRGWDAIVASRMRPPVRLEVEVGVEIRGDRRGSVDAGVRCRLTRVGANAVMLIEHSVSLTVHRVEVSGLHSAIRAMQIANDLGVAVVTVIDTAGMALNGEQERQGPAFAIAESMRTMLGLNVPTVAVLAGQGSGGAAIAWVGADVVVAVPDAWMTPISPEASSLIVHKSADRADEMATTMRGSATELRELGLVDVVVAPGDLPQAVRWAIERASQLRHEPNRRSRWLTTGWAELANESV